MNFYFVLSPCERTVVFLSDWSPHNSARRLLSSSHVVSPCYTITPQKDGKEDFFVSVIEGLRHSMSDPETKFAGEIV